MSITSLAPSALRFSGVLFFLAASVLGGPAGGSLAAQDRPVWADSIYSLIESDLQRVLADQETYFQENQSYASDLGSLGCESSQGVTIGVAASASGFSAVGFHEFLGNSFGCAVYWGQSAPPFFPLEPGVPGQMACTQGAPPFPRFVPSPDLSAGPAFLPYDVAPEIQDPEKVRADMERRYPDALKNQWIGGTVEVSLFVCDKGNVRSAVLSRSSGYKGLDDAALAVAQGIAFEPALYLGHSVGAWVSFPITFKPR